MRMKTFMLVVAIVCSLTGVALAASPQAALKVSSPVPLADFLTSLKAPAAAPLPDFTPRRSARELLVTDLSCQCGLQQHGLRQRSCGTEVQRHHLHRILSVQIPQLHDLSELLRVAESFSADLPEPAKRSPVLR